MAGASYATVNGYQNSGCAYVFVTEDNGYSWSLTRQLIASDIESSSYLGFRIALYGDTVHRDFDVITEIHSQP